MRICLIYGTAESTVTQTADRQTVSKLAENGKHMYYVGLIRSDEKSVGRCHTHSWNARVVQMLFRVRSLTHKRTPVPRVQYRLILTCLFQVHYRHDKFIHMQLSNVRIAHSLYKLHIGF
jgi:hypothetical protein